jgi:glycosyltransferase involved in cell wall biosynthesis
MYIPECKSEFFLKGDFKFSELIKAILPGEASLYTIAILISIFLKSEGASRVAELQARELSAMGYSVVVFTFESDIHPTGYRVKIIESWTGTYTSKLSILYRALFPFNLWKSLRLSSKLKTTNLIIVHQETLVNVAYYTKLFYESKLIYWHHHITDSRLMTLEERLYNLIISPFNWRKIKKFNFVVSISEHSKAMLRDEKDVESIVVYDEIESNRFNNNNLDGTSIRIKYNIEFDDPVILFVGRITPTKNIHFLISAFRIVKMTIPNVKLIIVGRAYNKPYAEGLMRNCDPGVFFAGFVADEELPNYYAACDVYATCSLAEGFNMPLVEAQACGRSVVAFDIGPHREVVKNGLIVAEGDLNGFGAALIYILTSNKGIVSP